MKKTVLLLLAIVLFGSKIYSQTDISRAEAMFIYNFSRLAAWPDNYKSGNFIIGVMGESPVFKNLQSFTSGKKVGVQNITIKQFSNANAIEKCHIIFVPFNHTKLLGEIKAKVGTNSTLIITEKNGAINSGSSINFLILGSKLKYEISESNAMAQKIKISSKLKDMAFKAY